MAGEYSRELSAKVFAGQCRLIELGFRQGGPAGFGLRRALVDQQGVIKAELGRGEQKSLQTDRVILRPGPEAEVTCVRQIYNWFIEEGSSESEIAQRLNDMNVSTDLGREWSRATVREVLTVAKWKVLLAMTMSVVPAPLLAPWQDTRRQEKPWKALTWLPTKPVAHASAMTTPACCIV